MIVATALTCMAISLYHEARGEPVIGKYAIAMVKLNRAQQDHDRICDVTFQRKQFSWTTAVKKTEEGWYIPAHMRPKLDNPIEAEAWARVNIIANVALSGRMWDFTRGADHYHATHVNPRWASSMTPVRRIGRHIFYVRES